MAGKLKAVVWMHTTPLRCRIDAWALHMSWSETHFRISIADEPKAVVWTHTTPLRCGSDAWAHHDLNPGAVAAWPTNLGEWRFFPKLSLRPIMRKPSASVWAHHTSCFTAPLHNRCGILWSGAAK